MDEEWVDIHDFPNYRVSTLGNVFNSQFERIVKTSSTNQQYKSTLKVGLMEGGVQYTRSVKILVADAFVDGRTLLFDTAVQLDGDHLNCRADNLIWRPRWFAWKHTRQFVKEDSYSQFGPVLDTNTGEVYLDVYQCALRNGLLFSDIRRSIMYNRGCFPNNHIYRIAK